MKTEEAKKEKCGRIGCKRKAILTTRIMTDEGPIFDCFCRKHLFVAYEYIKDLAKTIGAPLDEHE